MARLRLFQFIALGAQIVDLGQHSYEQYFGRRCRNARTLSCRISFRWRATWIRIRSISKRTDSMSGMFVLPDRYKSMREQQSKLDSQNFFGTSYCLLMRYELCLHRGQRASLRP